MKVFVIGRDPVVKAGETAFKINDPSNVISRTHCRITQIDNQTFFIEDAGSKNGTFINNKLLDQPLQIQADEVIKLTENISFTPNEVSLGLDINIEKDISNNFAEKKVSKDKVYQEPEQAVSFNQSKVNTSDQKPDVNQVKPSPKNYQQPHKQTPPLSAAQPSIYENIASVFTDTGIGQMSAGALLSIFAATLVAAAAVYMLAISDTISFSSGSASKQASLENLNFNIYGRYLHFDDLAGYTIMKPFDNKNLDTSMMQIMISRRHGRRLRYKADSKSINIESFISNGIDWRVNHYFTYETHPYFNELAPVKGFEAIGDWGDEKIIYITAQNIHYNKPDETDLENFMKILRSISK